MNTVNIYEIEGKVRSVFTKLGYSERRIYDIIIVVHKIVRLHEERGKGNLDNRIVSEHLDLYESRCRAC